MDRFCYLFGANPNLKDASVHFAKKAGGKDGHIVLLILRREGWDSYLPKYTSHWKEVGVKKITTLLPEENGLLDTERVISILEQATGIFIGGGDTEKYHEYYGKHPIQSIIRKMYGEGIPIAGCSAGALLIPETCIISPVDSEDETGKHFEGLGLIRDVAIGVHFSEWNDRHNLEQAMNTLEIANGYGIDEEACAIFNNGVYYRSFGEHVHYLCVSKIDRRNMNIDFMELKNETMKQTICERLLRMLPNWFGIEESIQNYVADVKSMPMLVGKHDEEFIGFISISEQTVVSDEIHLMAVNPRFHRLGIGKMLIAEMEQRSIVLGKKFITVKTLSHRHPDPHYRNTRFFYEGVGFLALQELPELWGDENPCLLMVKKL